MKVYLAGPIAGTSDAQANEWRNLATDFFATHGIDVLNPMTGGRDFRGVEDTPEVVKTIVEGDKRDIAESDVVLANCWKTSVGTSQEIIHAWEHGKHVVVHVPAGQFASPWLTYHSHLLTASMSAALEWIVGYHHRSARRDIHLEVEQEEQRQDRKWGRSEHHYPNGTGRPGDDHLAWTAREKCKANTPATDNWRDILEEEAFEAFAERDPTKLRHELIQVCAVAVQWIADLDRSA